jgi:plasmid maintenance system antidote protein VapI
LRAAKKMENRMPQASQIQPGAGAALLDHLIEKLRLKNDAALARAFEVAPPVISKIRHDKLPFGDSMILKAHEKYDFTLQSIRQLLAGEGA